MGNMTKEMYEQRMEQEKAKREIVKNDPNRLRFHLQPPMGWLNDPNGLCQMDGVYHIYYQYSPFEPMGGTKLWGHYTTKDFVHFKDHEPFLYADWRYDERGVYSGSAFVEDGTIHFFYTGNVKLFDRDDYDYCNNGREQNTIHVTSEDGFSHTEKELVMTNSDYPADMSTHVRDPKIFKKDGVYYMVLGARDVDSHGLLLMYRSTDLKDWTLFDRLTMPDFGYMWECPDLFELDGELFLVFSPQGLEAKGWDNRNVYQTGYCRLDYDFDTKEYAFSPFQELDRGFDYYAPQSFLDEQGRHIQFGWMGMGDAPYTNAPTIEHAWQHALTLPRELRAKDGHLYQMPIVEIEQLRQEKYESSIADFEDPGFGKSYEMIVTFAQSAPFSITVDDEATLAYDGSVLRLTMKEGGYGRDERGIEIDAVKNIRLFKDTSSLEIFVNDGWTVFSSRVYSTGEPNVRIEAQGEGTVTMYELDSIEMENA
ncbi:glycoside hydrolase family 32 protein [uncultured Dubosiella sp.]|uniref:glycoside hydrolase family 32 protein n=1 Tax=uncultured Dubosiella sp. TaxID=1937011 RepID=UPI002731D5D2|nr:glycoside hydrolase family 32 protein [uncultured Dubosiella sp.]